jgi:hypothetical protein
MVAGPVRWEVSHCHSGVSVPLPASERREPQRSGAGRPVWKDVRGKLLTNNEATRDAVLAAIRKAAKPATSWCFSDFLDQHVPAWREARAELNALPLADENVGPEPA